MSAAVGSAAEVWQDKSSESRGESNVMKTLMQQALDDLEAKGLIVRNGKMRRNRPVYVLAPKYVNEDRKSTRLNSSH